MGLWRILFPSEVVVLVLDRAYICECEGLVAGEEPGWLEEDGWSSARCLTGGGACLGAWAGQGGLVTPGVPCGGEEEGRLGDDTCGVTTACNIHTCGSVHR